MVQTQTRSTYRFRKFQKLFFLQVFQVLGSVFKYQTHWPLGDTAEISKLELF